MLTVCRRYACDQSEAEDILQDAFIKVFTHLDQYRFEGSLEGWIRRIVVHCALKALQKKRIRFPDIAVETEALPSGDAGALSAMSAAELLKLISALPDGYRIVFNLYVIEGYDHNEIAALLDISPATMAYSKTSPPVSSWIRPVSFAIKNMTWSPLGKVS